MDMNKIKYYFIVTASGVGKRMGLPYPKQFHEILGRPIFIKTLEEISKSKFIDKVIITTNKEDIDTVKQHIDKYNINLEIEVIEGGSERQYSVYNAIKIINDRNAIIGVQDAVRPNIKANYIDDTYNQLLENKDIDGFVVGVPSKDTIKIIDEHGFITSTPKREYIFNAHTPQVFNSEILTKAYEMADKDNFLGTDDASLVERINGKIKIYVGEYDNIKVTTIDDLKFFE